MASIGTMIPANSKDPTDKIAVFQPSLGATNDRSMTLDLLFDGHDLNDSTVWAAKGDLVTGLANDSGGILTIGTNGYMLIADSTQPNGMKWAREPAADLIQTKGDMIVGTAADTLSRLAATGNSGMALVSDTGQATNMTWAYPTFGVNIVLGDGINVLTSGTKGYFEWPFSGTITQITLLADVNGNAVLDLYKDSYGNYPPTVADTIVAAAKPTLSGAQKYQDAVLTGWTKTFSAGQVLAVNVDSADTLHQITLSIRGTRNLNS